VLSGATNIQLAELDSDHCRAICDEIGARLALILQPETADLPSRIAKLLDRLALLDHIEDAPSISPSLEDMLTIEPSTIEAGL
jgi:hypothetical protein